MRGVVRPYSVAGFAFARGKHALSRERDVLGEWSVALAALAAATAGVLEQTRGRGLVADDDLRAAVVELCGEKDANRLNFLTVLAQNGRLRLLPEIVEMFEELRRDAAGVVTVRVESALPVSGEARAVLEGIMAKWTGCKAEVRFEENAELLGGVCAYARDDVLDASVRGRLNKMASALGVRAPGGDGLREETL